MIIRDKIILAAEHLIKMSKLNIIARNENPKDRVVSLKN
ncbi:hypothetical protein SAMN05421510_1001117 [Nitrosomonas ureae]|uniref:Uncharacterized protein n=1 Tax=Nitrosomonas ureae TaxID=44577 RepID=A0A1H8ZLL2_9PROT|nr:hypothetical protein SAMN05216406_10785 [Nitrosomonas ureae]SEP65366.1 hypothetical protein SAMN05421510_1001117 [Nitrosomonas ureae]